MVFGSQLLYLSVMLVAWLTGAVLPANTLVPSVSSDIGTRQSLNVDLLIPIYDDQGAAEIIGNFGHYIQKDDTFILVSGNNARKLDVEWLNDTAEEFEAAYPENRILAMTAGLSNLHQLMSGGPSSSFVGVVYVYEPNMENGPEFDWDFTETLSNFDRAAVIVNAGGLQFLGKPTGQPLLADRLARLSWNYGTLADHSDDLIIQTQTWCKQGKFDAALARIVYQFGDSGTLDPPWIPQVSIDPGSPNGVRPEVSANCIRSAANRGAGKVLVWWSPDHPAELEALLGLMGRGGQTLGGRPPAAIGTWSGGPRPACGMGGRKSEVTNEGFRAFDRPSKQTRPGRAQGQREQHVQAEVGPDQPEGKIAWREKQQIDPSVYQ